MPWRDLMLAARSLRKSPSFAFTAVVMIAAGTGAVALMFSVMNSVLLRPLPYKDPERLVVAYGDLRARANFGAPLSNENFVDIAADAKDLFQELAAVRTGTMILTGPDGGREQVRFGQATPNLFRTLGAGIAAGRDFEEADGQPQTGAAEAAALPNMVILSYEYWRRRYGGDRAMLGRSLDGGPGRSDRIVGVLAPGFELLFAPADNVELRPDVWFAGRPVYNNANRNTFSLRPIGRLRRGVTVERAQAAVESTASHIRRDYTNYSASDFHARLEPMHKALVAQVRPTVLVLMGSVILLFLIACANVLNLMLVRSSLRVREMAVRAALGSGMWPLVRLALAEALILTAAGTAAGVMLARTGLRSLLAVAPANLPRAEEIRLDPIVLAVTAFAGLVAATALGLLPTWAVFRGDIMKVLRGTSRTAGLSGGGKMRSVVLVVEVALCFSLLIGSGLMLRSFLVLQRIDPGFDPRGLLTFDLLGGPDGSVEGRAAHARLVEQSLRAIPGVVSVSASNRLPLAGGFTTIRWGTEAALTDPTKFQAVDWQLVRPGYFTTMRTALLDGRDFSEADNDPARNLVVVDQFLAAKAFPGVSAVGKRLLTRIRTPEPEWVEIAGVVAHQRVGALSEPGREQIYFTDGFLGFGQANRWKVRTGGDAAAYAPAVRAAMNRLDPKLLLTGLTPMETLVRQAQSGTTFSLELIGSFTAVGVLLVAVGLYGVLATLVQQRTAEIGVRMALGATPGTVLRMVIGYALRLCAAGVALGLVTAAGLSRAMKSMLVGVEPADPLTYATMAAVFVVLAAAAAWRPARRAAELDPAAALRRE